ncbi:2-C-methyl-D-erythritol 4-phosphate cytidylyltransferase [Xanthovirga aplysinae]|uniref:2-C-methyl-D-erythritol 4-phosphate cytidylyltransferase n=1 Tax=Xanthovirga aplysinae TaxID=2529853 RepID=UPI0012BC70B3|nr:2-C-methyl-D-erythritol 4-phosphate cytidylyltransferase [Xanthovirga aplysinae]MTI30969.1 2-C-methyl-D-erythritol 4-phosphate cytidylyltransferase [Xanthovirga aplysinae]
MSYPKSCQIKKYVIIVAGGSGSRMKTTLPKQFLEVGGKPILMHTLSAFHHYDSKIEIILVLPEKDMEQWDSLCEAHSFRLSYQIKKGGISRFQSVKNGLEAIKDEGLVAIHDGVRPFIDRDVIDGAFRTAAEKGNAVVAVPLKDSIRKLENSYTVALDRNLYRLVQTPQVFRTEIIKKAYDQSEKAEMTDDASVAESAGLKIELVPGHYENIKITTPEDLYLAEAILRRKSSV